MGEGLALKPRTWYHVKNTIASVGESKLSIQSNVVAIGESILLFYLLQFYLLSTYMRLKTNASMFLILLINTVEMSDKVSRLMNIEFTNYRHEISLLDFQGNAAFNPLNDQSKSVFNCSLISLLKALHSTF
jgi:hypothetical protein